MTATIALDTSVIVALANEAISVIGRRAEEQQRLDQFDRLVDTLTRLIPESAITWISGSGQRLFRDVVALCRSHHGVLNFHDALMALACGELGVRFVASFDRDFDRVPWVSRLADAARVQALLRPSAG